MRSSGIDNCCVLVYKSVLCLCEPNPTVASQVMAVPPATMKNTVAIARGWLSLDGRMLSDARWLGPRIFLEKQFQSRETNANLRTGIGIASHCRTRTPFLFGTKLSGVENDSGLKLRNWPRHSLVS